MLSWKFGWRRLIRPIHFEKIGSFGRKLSHVTQSNPMRMARKVAAPKEGGSISMSVEEIITNLKKKKLLLRGAMLRKRSFLVTIPAFGSLRSEIPFSIVYQWSNLAGHGSFVFLAISYLESDFLNLRLFAIGGITMSMIFQYYREKPLWIPLRWNSLFLIINAIMVVTLIKEASDAYNMSDELKQIYISAFQKKGMKHNDYMRLIERAERQVLQSGDKVMTMGSLNQYVYLVYTGRLSVTKGGQYICKLGENQVHDMILFTDSSNHILISLFC